MTARRATAPETNTSPALGRTSPASRCSSVVFPDPDLPTTTVNRPRRTDRSSSDSTERPLYAFVTPRSSARTSPRRRRLERRWLVGLRSAVGVQPPPLDAPVALDGDEPRPRAARQPDPAACRDHERRLLVGLGLLDDAAVAHVNEPVRDRGRCSIVADDERSGAGGVCDLRKRVVDGLRSFGVELPCRLVDEQQPRVGARSRRRRRRAAARLPRAFVAGRRRDSRGRRSPGAPARSAPPRRWATPRSSSWSETASLTRSSGDSARV